MEHPPKSLAPSDASPASYDRPADRCRWRWIHRRGARRLDSDSTFSVKPAARSAGQPAHCPSPPQGQDPGTVRQHFGVQREAQRTHPASPPSPRNRDRPLAATTVRSRLPLRWQCTSSRKWPLRRAPRFGPFPRGRQHLCPARTWWGECHSSDEAGQPTVIAAAITGAIGEVPKPVTLGVVEVRP